MDKDIYELNNVLFEVRTHENNLLDFWIQVGAAGILVDEETLSDLLVLVSLYFKERVDGE